MTRQREKPVLCLTFDNMGEAHNVFLEKSATPDFADPAILVGYPNILNLLAKYDLKATFFVEGWSALHYGDVVESIQRGGHEIGLHGWIHEIFADLPQRTARQFVNDGVQTLKLRGVSPAGFRAPGGKIGPFGLQILAETGFSYDSSVDTAMPDETTTDPGDYAGDGPTRSPEGLIRIPWQWFMIDAIHYVLAENGLRNPDDLAAFWSMVLRNVADRRGFVTMINHAHITGVDAARLAALEKVIAHALDLGFEIMPCRQAIDGY
ncbi:polysaccharide deacetylase family protein [Hoeflea sp. WL0058]|uniref:Chitooligosaccharide deacetylase n=1 Tax=Flavimaribacter sediminis TaxID=2865987 RepID=A0AAE3D3R7_9HYPH|nr:polysaccharide deacetylase family protein [Flavimaribacter sediminis]MBW8640116.1 polysaccharide deacetylase family protein [Flavimaribacter sediminis]